jgi:two-component system, chemotaxis family, CheB/CheR fusion protein
MPNHSVATTLLQVHSVLVADDDPAHVDTIGRAFLAEYPDIELRVVDTSTAFLQTVAAWTPDVAVVDLGLPGGGAGVLLPEAVDLGAFPIVLIVTRENEREAVTATEGGAMDYVVSSPDALAQLPHTVRNAIRSWRLLADRRAFAAALSEREQLLQLFVEHSPAAIAMLDRDMRYIVVSRRWMTDYRVAQDSIIGLTHYEAFPEIPERWRRVHQRCLAGAVEHSDADWFPRQDGGFDWLRWEVRPWFTTGGAIGGIIIFSEIITDRIRAEEELLASERRTRGTLESMLEGCQIIDRNWRYSYVNPSAARQGKTTVDALVGRTMMEAYPGIETLPLFDMLQRCMYDRTPQQLENEFTFPDGSRGWYELLCQPVEVGVFILSLDITARKRAEEALRQSETRYRALVETTYDWVWEVDAEGRYTYASPKVLELLGYTPAEVIGRTPFDLMPADEAERLQAVFGDIVSRRTPFAALENTNRHKDGHLVVLETSGSPVFGSNGAFLGYRGMDRDITDRKELEANLRQAQKLDAVGQLAGGVAHDFNNVLSAISLEAELLRSNPTLDEDARHGLDEMLSEVQRAAGITRQLLLFSRRSAMTVKPVDVNQVVENLFKMLRRLIGEHITLTFEAAPRLPLIVGDAAMVDQMVMNLVVNARDAMPNGGHIIVRTAVEQIDRHLRSTGTATESSWFVRLTVADTGCGIDALTIKRIFEPFFTTKEAGRGTGLGLSTVHGIVAQHNGWIDVDSVPDAGTTFRVYLPVLTDAEDLKAEAQAASVVIGGQERVLVVEDEGTLRRLVARTLSKLGYAVFEAATGRDALAIWNEHGGQFDLLFTDMVMPEGVSGLELALQLRSLKPALKTIISSGYTKDLAFKQTALAGDMVYLPKPYDVSALAQVVRTCLDGKE